MATRNVFKSIGAGMAYTWRDGRMRTIVAMNFLPSALVYPYMTFMPVFAKEVMGSDQQGYGFLAAAAGVGSLLGGGLVAWQGTRDRMGQRMCWTFLGYSGAICAFTLTEHLWLGVAILAAGGIFHSTYAALNASLLQLKADDRFRTQVMALQTMSWGVSPFAGLLMGRMVDQWGAPHVVLGWALTATLTGLAIALFSREMRRV
jgi:MFS family permease